MNRQDFSITNFNNDLQYGVRSQNVNFGALIAGSCQNLISVTAKYDPLSDKKRYVTLSDSLEVVDVDPDAEVYYGVSPRLDIEKILCEMSRMRFEQLTGLDNFIRENSHLFMLHRDQSEYLLDLARLIVISVVSSFGIKIRLNQEASSLLTSSLDYHRTTVKKIEKESMQCDQGNPFYTDEFYLLGCPTECILQILSDIRFQYCEDGFWESSSTGLTIQEIYSDKNNISLLNGKVFYSGVLLKPTRLEKKIERYENDFIESVIIHFERSTYATVFTLDNNFSNHPLLRKSNNKLVSMFRQDDQAKSTLITELENSSESHSQDLLLDSVNKYLDSCFNVNQVGVSANIITEDGVLLLGRRSQKTIDTGALYPSVNGNAEVADSDVSFYDISVYEDYPTIDLRQHRMDFLGEISREAYAELKLNLPELEWICHGLMISGTIPVKETSDSEYSADSRRMHFNILFEQKIKQNFFFTENERHSAAESFETESLIGFIINCYKSPSHMVLSRVLSFFKGIIKQKDVLESILILTLFFTELFVRKEIKSTWYDIATILLSVVIFISTLKSIYLKIILTAKNKRRIKRITLYKKMDSFEKDKKIHRLFEHNTFHPATYACIKAYTDKKLYTELFSDDNPSSSKRKKK